MLREDQVQRYSRQILLREVGGKGQARLLGRPVRVVGRSDAVDAAVAYLVAGGTAVSGVARDGRLTGFAHGVSLDALSPDAASERPAFATLAAAGQGEVPAGVTAILGEAGLVYAGPDACPACLSAALAQLAGDPPADAVLLGSLAALVLQRLALDAAPPEPGPTVLRWRDGALHADGPRCPAHAGTN